MWQHRGQALLKRDGWPPPGLPVQGENPCWACGQSFSLLWVHRGVCVECEARVRAMNVCPFSAACRGELGTSFLDGKNWPTNSASGLPGLVPPRLAEAVGVTCVDDAPGPALSPDAAGGACGSEAAAARTCRKGARPFCPHVGKCLHCEEVSCVSCRVHHLDGLGVAALVGLPCYFLPRIHNTRIQKEDSGPS
jgi:hypothetical protein